MPRAPKHCGIQGCTVLVPSGQRCPDHRHGWGKGNPRTTTPQHRDWSRQVRTRDGHCMIQRPGCTGTADTADHIVAVAFGGAEYDPANGQAACWSCHGWKSSREGHIAQGHQV